MHITEILGSPKDMLFVVFNKIEEMGLPSDLRCDHLCYRVASTERYQELKDRIGMIASLESEAMIYGRPICTFHLNDPITYQDQLIDCVELPSPKQGSPYEEGWEHAEFVTGMLPGLSAQQSLERFLSTYKERITFDTRGMNKELNPEIGVKLFGTPYQVKYHPRPLLDVIRLEKERGMG